MKTKDRGLIAPKKGTEWGHTTHVPKSTAYLEGTKGIFLTTDETPAILSITKPLLDRSNTPRGALRSITLDRNYTNQRWLYTKNSCDNFDPKQSKIEIKRSKDLKRITKREDKQKRLSSKWWCLIIINLKWESGIFQLECHTASWTTPKTSFTSIKRQQRISTWSRE